MSPQVSAELPVVQVAIDGSPAAGLLYDNLMMVRVETELRLPGRLTLRIAYPRTPEDKTQDLKSLLPKLGTEISVKMSGTQMISAEVTSVEVQHDPAESYVVVVGHDKAYRLFQGASYKSYVKVGYADIVSTMARAHGLQAATSSVPGTLDYLMQAESDGALLDALADRAGFDWWVAGTTLNFKAPAASAAAVKLSLNDSILELDVKVSQQPYTSATVVGRQPRKDQPFVQTATTASKAVLADSNLATSVKKSQGSVVQFGAETQAASAEESKAISQATLDRAAASTVTVTGRSLPAPTLTIGSVLEIADSGPTDGKYPVTAVEHTLRGGMWETRFRCGRRQPSGLVDTLSPKVSPSFQHLGLVVGVVTNIKDPSNAGRVKLKFPVLTGAGAAEPESDWARVVMTGAGGNRGAVFLPEVNDEVLVAFENGDVRYPVVIGGLYGEKTAVPNSSAVVDQGKVKGRRITSRTGHFVELGDDDQPTGQHVLLQITNGSTFRLGNDAVTLEAKEQKKITLTAGSSSIELDPAGTITLKGLKIVAKGDQAASIEAAQVDVKAQGQLNLQSQGQATLQGSVTNVKANGILQVQGTMVKIN